MHRKPYKLKAHHIIQSVSPSLITSPKISIKSPPPSLTPSKKKCNTSTYSTIFFGAIQGGAMLLLLSSLMLSVAKHIDQIRLHFYTGQITYYNICKEKDAQAGKSKRSIGMFTKTSHCMLERLT